MRRVLASAVNRYRSSLLPTYHSSPLHTSTVIRQFRALPQLSRDRARLSPQHVIHSFAAIKRGLTSSPVPLRPHQADYVIRPTKTGPLLLPQTPRQNSDTSNISRTEYCNSPYPKLALSLNNSKLAIMTTQSPEFQKAAEDSRKLKAKPGVDELLQVTFILTPFSST